MSDAQFRLLIQRSFDEELSKQEHRALIDHLEGSESGQKFHHQLDQMIQAAQDTPLPDELRPQNPEALARMIMEQLPQKKGSVFGFLTNLFSGGSGGAKPKQKKAEPQNGKGKVKDKGPDKGKFKGKGKGQESDFEPENDDIDQTPSPVGRGGMKFQRKTKEVDQEEIESQVGGFSRLKSIGTKAQEQENREAQSTTRSLGEKFSMPWAAQSGMDEGPLTLAESIKRKVTESQKLSPLDEDDLSGSQNELTGGGFAAPAQSSSFAPSTASAFSQPSGFNQPSGFSQPEESGNEAWGAPVNMPNKQPVKLGAPGPSPTPGGFAEPSGFASNQNIPAQTPVGFSSPSDSEHRGSAIGLAPKQQEPQAKAPVSDWGGSWAPEGGASVENKANWGGTTGNANASGSGAAIKPPQEAPKADWGSGWNAPTDTRQPLKSSESWAIPGSEGAGSWNSTPEPHAREAEASPAPAPVPAPEVSAQPPQPAANDPWGSAPAAANNSWNSAPAAANTGWGGEASAPAAWGQEVSAAPAPAPAPAPVPSPAPATPAAWGQEASPAAMPSPTPAAAPQASVSGWGETAAPSASPAGWGETAAPSTSAAGGWDQANWNPAPTPATSAPSQGAAPAPAPAPSQASAPASDPWAQATPAAAPGQGWGQTQGWSQNAAPQNQPAPTPAPAPAPAPTADPWAQPPAAVVTEATPAAPTTGGWGTPAAPADAKPAGGQKRSWATAEPDLIETGTFRAFTNNLDNQLGAKGRPEPPKPAANPFANTQVGGQPIAGAQPASDNRWDVPISERLPQQQMDGQLQVQIPGVNQPAAQAPQQQPQPASENRWDVPISERVKMQQDGQQVIPTPAPISPVGMPGTPGAGIPVNQIVEKMGEVLEGGKGQQQAADNRWDLPISERMKMQQTESGSQQQVQPVVEAAQQSGWNQPAQSSGWEQAPAPAPVQAVMQPAPAQEAPWGNAAAPIQAAAESSPWGNTAPQPAQDNNWGQAPSPVQSAQDNSPWATPAAPQPAQSSGWSNTPAAAPAPVQAAAESSPWNTAPQTPAASSGWNQAQPQTQAPANTWAAAPQNPAPPVVATPAQQAVSGGWGNEAPTAKAAEITDKGKAGGLFNIDNNAIDEIFGGMGVKESVSQTVVNTGSGEVSQPAAPVQQAAAPAAVESSPWATAQPAPSPVPTPTPTPWTAAPPAAAQASFAPPQNPAPAAEAQAAPAQKGLFQLNDNEVDQIFNKMGVEEPSIPIAKTGEMAAAFAPTAASQGNSGWAAPAAAAPAAAAWPAASAEANANASVGANAWPAAPAPVNGGWSNAPAQTAPQQPQGPPTGNLFSVDNGVMNSIFSGGQQPAAAAPAPMAIPQDLGPAPKIEGVGRLDANADNSQDTGSGRIAAIGKFLLDQKDLDKIGKLTNSDLAEGKLRILTMEASQDLQELLAQIGRQQGVIGSVIVGHDGLLIANTMPSDMDAESVGVWALGVYMNTDHVTKKMGHDRVHQVVSRTPRGYVVIADFGGGLLVTVTDGNDTDQLIPLMRTITLLVN